jgi:hypothetical protein
MFQTKFVTKIRTHFKSNSFCFENRADYGIVWKNILEADRTQMTVWRLRIACWIPKATNTQSGYVVLTADPLQKWLCERASVLRNMYFACLVIIFLSIIRIFLMPVMYIKNTGLITHRIIGKFY